MRYLEKNYYESMSVELLIASIGEHFSALKSVLKSDDISFEKSKSNTIETIELMEKHLAALQIKLKKTKE